MAASAASITAVQKAYVAYYGRPADPSGLDYWASRLDTEPAFSAMIDSFGNSDEATTLFGSLDNDTKINTIYQQIFGRDADSEGLAFYSNALTEGTMTAVTIAQNIIDGAQNDDATIVSNKLAAAQAFTDYLSTSGSSNYAGNDAAVAGRDWLNDVDATEASVTSASASIASTVDGLAPVPTNPGSTYTLTSADDDLVGTDKDDTFNARSVNISADDAVDGGAGTDTFNITVTGNVAAVEVDNVETVNLNVTTFTAPRVDLDNVDGSTINLNLATSGYSKTATLANVNDLAINIDDSMTTVTLEGYDEGDVRVGASMTSLTLDDAASDANLSLYNTAKVSLASASALSDLHVTAVGGARSIDINGSSALTGDIVLTGPVTLYAFKSSVDGATIEGADATVRIDNITAASTLSLEDIDVGTIAIDATNAIRIDAATDKAVSIIKASADVAVNAVSAGGALSVTVDANTVTLELGGADALSAPHRDSANVTFTSKANTVTAFNVGGATQATIAEATTFTAIGGSADSSLSISGTGNLTITDLDIVAESDFSGIDGTVTIANVGSTNGGISVVTSNTGADKVTLNGTSDVTLSTLGGDDTLVLTAFSVGDIYAAAGAGNDTFSFTAAKSSSADGTIVMNGGDGTDTIAFTNATGTVDLTGATVTLIDVEALSFKTDLNVKGSVLSGKTLDISAAAAAGNNVFIRTEATKTSLDLSGITFASNIETVTVSAGSTLTTVGFNFTGSSKAETVDAPAGVSKAFSIDLGAGNDTVIFDTTSTVGGTVTLGAGNDELQIDRITATGSGVSKLNTDFTDLTDLITITDYTAGADSLDFNSAGAAVSIIGDIGVATAVDLSGIATDTANAAAAVDDLVGYVKDGVLKLAGSDAGNIDTLKEWAYAAWEIAGDPGGGTAGGILAFEFGGDTYVTWMTTAEAEVATVKLEGITGHTLSTSAGDDVIKIV